jgi:hypothetical protein
MEACISCEGIVDAATRQCLRCGSAQPEPGDAENGSRGGTREELSAGVGTGGHEPQQLPIARTAGEIAKPPPAALTEIAGPSAAQATEAAAAEVMEAAAEVVTQAAADALQEAAADKKESGDDDRPLIDIFRARRIKLQTLPPPLRLPMYAAIVQTVLVALLLLAGLKVSQPVVSSGVQDQAGGNYIVPLAVFVVMAISVAAGYWLALAGAMRVRAAAGLPIITATTITLAAEPISKLSAGPAVEPHEWLRWVQLGVLALLWAWELWNLAAQQLARRGKAGHKSPAGNRLGVVMTGVLAVIVAYYALEFAIWGSYTQAGRTAAGTGFLLDDLSFQAILLPVFLTLVVLMGSTDMLDWGDHIAARRTAWLKLDNHQWLLPVLTPATACLVIASVLRTHLGKALPELMAGVIVAGIVGLLVYSGTGYIGWSDDVRSKAVLVGAIAVFSYTTVFANVTSTLGGAAGLSSLFDSQLYWLISTPVLLALLTAGLFLLAGGRSGKHKPGAIGLFLAMIGTLTLIAEVPEFVNVRKLPSVTPWQPYTLVSSVQLAAALGALTWVGWLMAHKRLKTAADQLASIFLLLIGLEIVAVILDLLRASATLSKHSAFALAGIFLLTGLWNLITSGDKLNSEQPAAALYPRDGRVTLFAGYTLIANATLVYLGTLRVPAAGAPPSDYLTADFTPEGLGILGLALVVLTFILRWPQRPRPIVAAEAERGAAAPAWRLAPKTIQRGILGAGVVVTIVALVFVSVSAAPRLAQASAQQVSLPYQALIPGPGCDSGGTLSLPSGDSSLPRGDWSVPPGFPITTRCLRTGLQVAAAHRGSGDVQFLPPSGTFPQNYRVSVQVNLSHMPDGCASIYTRSTSAGHYVTSICTNALPGAQTYVWGIQRVDSATFKQLALGTVPKANEYTLAATAANSTQQITIDGASASVSDAKFSATRSISLGISDSSPQGGSAVFSNFRFMPLPAHPRLGPSASATPSQRPPQASASASATPSPASPSSASIRDQVSSWFVNGGRAELDLLSARVTAVGLAQTYAAAGRACSELATAVTAAQADPPIPDAPAQTWLTRALANFGTAAAICQQAATAHSLALLNKAAVPMRAANADIRQVFVATAHD